MRKDLADTEAMNTQMATLGTPLKDQMRRNTMKLGLLAGGIGPRVRVNLEVIKHAETLGFDSVWTVEVWGGDAVTFATWMLAHTEEEAVPPSCRCRRAHQL